MATTNKSEVELLVHTDALLAACASLRGDLRAYETTLRRIRAQIVKRRDPSTLTDVPDFVRVRSALTAGIADVEFHRRRWRATLFRFQAAGGLDLKTIGQRWGLSRQLVSRLVHTQRDIS